MVHTSLDILYLALAAGFIVLVVFLSIALTYLIFLLRDLTKAMDKVEEIVERINEYMLAPVKFVSAIASHMGPFLEILKDRVSQVKRKKKSEE